MLYGTCFQMMVMVSQHSQMMMMMMISKPCTYGAPWFLSLLYMYV